MTLLVPSSLLMQAGDSKDAQRFVLASSEWLDLQNRVQAVLALPTDITEYAERYGDASSGSQMKDCFDAMHMLQQTASRYGSPSSLRARILKNPNFLASDTRPSSDAFSATVWTVQRAHQNALTVSSMFKGFPAVARGESAASVAAGVKSMFFDQGQMIDQMQRTVDQVKALIDEFTSIESELDKAQLRMKTFTDRSSKTRTSLDEEIGALRVTIASLEQARNTAYNKWVALTVAACAAPAIIGIVGIAIMVILAVPTGGASFAVGSAITGGAAAIAAGALGAAAGVARTTYDDLVIQVQAKDEFLAKRVCYRSDLGALDELMNFSLPASSGVIGQLGAIRDAWSGSIREMSAKANELSADNLANAYWLKDQQVAATAAGWSRLDAALQAFTIGSFVDADVMDFGSELPADDPNWGKQFAIKSAA
ncbi:MAG: hypothetical protein JWQ01_2843 [Massilia sp.]|jgi:hypothetical protein|nr:hypothetical protein [Massilia sp.]